jgi:AraC family transcriptional regulator, dual regulator of chb operon
MSLITLSHTTILGPEHKVLLTRATLDSKRPSALHDHDFHELIWVQNGTVRHHMAELREDLSEGDMVFIRPGDRHALQGRGDEAMVVSVTFHPGLIDALAERHPALAGTLFWSTALQPVKLPRDARQLADLNQSALRLERGRRDALEAEAFLLPLVTSLAGMTPLPRTAPDWLLAACDAARDPRVFREGAAGFAKVAGKAHPHVSRTARRYLGQSPSDYVNGQRMAFAARRLTGSSDSLTEIASDCGIPNLSHFHKLFREFHGQTPQKFRRTHQRDVVQPG